MAHTVMLIGHSLVGHTLPQMLAQLLTATDPASRVDAQVINGAPLIYQWDNSANAEGADARALLPSGAYDTLVMTEALPLADHLQWSDTWGMAGNFDQLAITANPSARVMIYETWHVMTTEAAWRANLTADLALWQGIVDHLNTTRLPGQTAATLLPAGQAMARLYDTIADGNGLGLTSIREVYDDEIHLNDTGNYLTALVHYSATKGLSAVGLPAQVLNPYGIAYTGWTEAQANLLQHIAWEAVALHPGAQITPPTLLPELRTATPGDDRLVGSNGDNRIYGGLGLDTLLGGRGSDLIDGGLGEDLLKGGLGDDWLYGGTGTNRLHGEADADRIFGGDDADFAYGGTGADRIDGGAGSDRLRGGDDADTLDGGAGNDLLWGEAGDDRLTGGTGADRFVFAPGMGADTVTDFALTTRDRLQLSPALWTTPLTAQQVIDSFARIDAAGVVFDFGPQGRVTLEGLTTLDGLATGLLLA